MADTLERYEHLCRKYITDLSHELRTPLSVLLAEIDAVLRVACDILNVFENRLTQAGITVQSDLGTAGVIVMGERTHLSQVFTNLVENTLKYTDTPGRLNIAHNVTGREVRLVFDDSPPGVGLSDMPYIFERLYRTDRSRSRVRSGSGLGLAISKAIIEAVGGTIKASASPLGGLRIEIVLPLAQKVKTYMEKGL